MERKSVVMVRWKRNNKWEAYSSLTGFCARHREYETYCIYNKWVGGVFEDYQLELRRVPFVPHPLKTRKGNLKRAKPGPKRGSKRAPRKEAQ